LSKLNYFNFNILAIEIVFKYLGLAKVNKNCKSPES